MLVKSLLAASAFTASLVHVQATLSNMRGTIPGSLHQCEESTFFFFDTDDTGSKTLLFLSPQDADSVGSGVVNLADVLEKVTPLQTINGITAQDAASSNIQIKLKEDTEFAVFGFLSDGQGKDLNLDRSVQAPLPDAANCLSGAAAVASTKNDDPVTVIPPAPTSTTSSSSTKAPAPPASSTSGFAKTVKVTSFLDVTSTSTSTVPTTPPAATASSSSSASAASAAPSTATISAEYLLTSFISLGNETGSDGSVLSRNIVGGHIRGSLNATILPFGSVLFGLSSNTTTSSNSSSSEPEETLLSATYSFALPESMGGSVVFAMAQTPLSTNFSTDALVLSFQNASSGGSAFENGTTILGKTTSINSTMFRIDAFTVEAPASQ